jgi:predicted AAA+ superfamily ATPase
MHYIHRLLEQQLSRYLLAFPVVGVTGPRQSGKSTLLRHQLTSKYRYVTFDNQSVVDAFYSDPMRFMGQYADHVIFDEVQKTPEIFIRATNFP